MSLWARLFGKQPEYLTSVERLTLKAGDIIVVSSDQILPDEVAARIKEGIKDVAGSGRKVIVLSGGLKIGVMGP